ncbi:MAG: hypothetical protein JSW61_14180 [Candidatus Thorarchaeota archaeon]|nr:MAG: hypothetical protein JSW61_14180 [Candidatus Thorarchaeota archaeon]
MQVQHIMCPVCGGRIPIEHNDKVNRCEYCASPVLGSDQNRNCSRHPDRLAVEVCHVCNEMFCEEDIEYRVADYGGKLFTIVNCDKEYCVDESQWAKPLNREYQQLVNMDWADNIDNLILRVTGLGAVLMMIFELVFVLSMIYLQYFTTHSANLPMFFLPGDIVIVLSILGNLLSAILLQTALQVYIHERQLGSGIVLLIILVAEAAFLIGRGLYFNLLINPIPWLLPLLFGAFTFSVILVFIGSMMATAVGYKKHKQFRSARITLGLTAER